MMCCVAVTPSVTLMSWWQKESLPLSTIYTLTVKHCNYLPTSGRCSWMFPWSTSTWLTSGYRFAADSASAHLRSSHICSFLSSGACPCPSLVPPVVRSAVMCSVKPDGVPQLCRTDEVGELCVCAVATGTSYYGLSGMTKNTFEVGGSGARAASQRQRQLREQMGRRRWPFLRGESPQQGRGLRFLLPFL